ncbi:spatacsin [Athalia rosae]|uniref:spatacsin n=1 Tax=Athalia rosae TaxID=37344 RepID=UPI0020336285|nr:spatacsin [Athalia rosae]
METVGGIPVECLTGELVGVWSGWRTLGDREVVREAAAKGTHIKLSQKCLASRRHCSLKEAQAYFEREVNLWIDELLAKQQVFRATHIIKNMGKDPAERINSVCVNSTDPKLRDYLCHHLQKIDGLTERETKAWWLIKLMDEYVAAYSMDNNPMSNESIRYVIDMPDNYKTVLCTDLYFCTFDAEISRNISAPVAWDYLLMTNKLNILSVWININYNSPLEPVPLYLLDKHIVDNLQRVLSDLKITQSMVDSVHEADAADVIKELVLDRLARRAVFTSKESIGVKPVLNRLLNNGIVPSKFEEILKQNNSTINPKNFLPKLNIGLYSNSYLENSVMQEVDENNRKLYSALEYMAQNSATVAVYESCVLSNVDCATIDDYWDKNPLVLLNLIFSQCNVEQISIHNTDSFTMMDRWLLSGILNNDRSFSVSSLEISKITLKRVVRNFPHLGNALWGNIHPQEMSMYDLLDGYENFNVPQGFAWRHKDREMPTCCTEYLIKKYGHKEKLTYINYLRQGRPNMATRILLHDLKKFHQNISLKMKCQASTRAHALALRNADLPEVTSACVSFIEIIGVDSENLRLHLTITQRIREGLGTSVGKQLEAILFNDTSNLNVLTLQLEQCFKQHLIEFLDKNTEQLIEAIRDWDVIVRFAQAHNSPLPNFFLRYLASRDLWFQFLLVGQIFIYPVVQPSSFFRQMISLARKFANPDLRDHLLACLSSLELPTIHTTDGESRSHDLSQSLYPKIASKENESRNGDLKTSRCSNDIKNNYSSNNDLWMTILNCHNSQDPPGSLLRAASFHRSPFLIVLATCYEPSSVAAYWCSWTVIATNDTAIISDYQDCLECQVWTADRVLQLLKRLVLSGFIKTMSRGLEIFMPENPLQLFAHFLMHSVDLGDFESGKKSLKAFKSACSTLVCNAKINWMDCDSSYLKNSYWIVFAAARCAVVALAHRFSNTILRIEFLDSLCSCHFADELPEASDFQRLLKVMEILVETDVTLNLGQFSDSECSDVIDDELKKCLAKLAESENYKAALQLCEAVKFDCSEIITAQWHKNFANSRDVSGMSASSLWKSCADDFYKYHVKHDVAASFYVEHAEKVASHRERFEILRLALETLQETNTNRKIIDSIEMAMWKSCFLAGSENVYINDTPVAFNKLKTELMSGLVDLQVRCELNDPYEKLAVEKLIDRFIDVGNLQTALRIATIFNHKHRDLQILMLCLSLAEEEISPYQLTTQQRMLFSTKSRLKNQWQVPYRRKGLPKSCSLTSLQNISDEASQFATETADSVLIEQIKLDCIVQLQKLTEILTHGVTVGRKVLLCYRLSVYLCKSYQTLLTLDDPIAFLEEIVAAKYDYKLEVVKDVVAAYSVNNRQLADFLSDKIITTITRHTEREHPDQPMTMWGYALDGSFHIVTEICGEPSLLGSKLLEATMRLLGRSHGENRDVTTLRVIVELLIKSHDCFTAACNMEGISLILRKSQQLANSLQNLKEWGLLVRLLTGVGRFTEMNYILQILKENQQFEFLLKGKGLEKIPGLKTALLDFLKGNSTETKELFNMVTNHFLLYTEIALTWEHEAKEAINKLFAEAKAECKNQGNMNIADIRLTKNVENEKRLHLAMVNYTHATEHYLRDNKLTLAYQCCHRAELVALQISFFQSVNHNQQVPCVLDLSSAEIDRLISNDLSFSQANILVRAYNHPVDWGIVIYNHCVLRCDTKYLKDFSTTNELTVTIVRDSARRYQAEKKITKQMAEAMQLLISLLKDVECKYTLASQLGFKNVIETILANPLVSAYLKDTVWRKGYTSTTFD